MLSDEDATLNRIRSIFKFEYDLDVHLKCLRDEGSLELASAVERLVDVVTASPPRWIEAEHRAGETAALGYGSQYSQFESLRNAVMRALVPLLWRLPETSDEMADALRDPS